LGDESHLCVFRVFRGSFKSAHSAAADAQPAAAGHHTMNARPSRCPHGEEASRACRICRRRRAVVDGRALDLFVGGVLGGSVGVLLIGMTASLVLGRGFDTAGLIVGALSGLALVQSGTRL
jgi:hypothetical protein